MQVQISPAAAAFVRANGGELWIWAARPRMCCAGTPAWMHTALRRPEGRTGFVPLEVVADALAGDAALSDGTAATSAAAALAGIRIYFRSLGGLSPDVLEIGMQGRRNPRVEAYWDGCYMAMA
ncbi:MAG: hypothetical protein ACLQFR_23470 [Streptosporangiaceae bacterium]